MTTRFLNRRSEMKIKDQKKEKIDWMVTLFPLVFIVGLCIMFVVFPNSSNEIIGKIRFILGDTLGVCYLIIGFAIFLLSIYIACSRYGMIVLGEKGEKPQYSFFTWGSMMFTAGLAADILFYSFGEWILYASDPHMEELGDVYTWAGVYSLFHWSLIPWSFYLVLAVAFGFMLHVRKRKRQKYSEACRPLLGKYTDGILGRLIDLLAVFALLAGTATTFGVATPLMANAINELFGIKYNPKVVTISILIFTCVIYTYALLHGFRGINRLAKICVYLFFTLLLYVLVFGGETGYIIEMGVTSLGLMLQNFIELSTFTDSTRSTFFPQNWTIFYWAYWMVWCVAAPFFIGSISRGRTIKQTIIGGYGFGVGSTVISFIILGNYSLKKQITGDMDFLALYQKTGNLYDVIIEIIKTLPCSALVLTLLFLTMIAFYSTSFDSIALIGSYYSYYKLEDNEQPRNGMKFMWCILLILLPIALVFSDSSMNNLQSVSIIAAFPIAGVIILIVASFIKDADRYLKSG